MVNTQERAYMPSASSAVVIVELKAVTELNNAQLAQLAQLLSYLGATGLHLGLLMNFNAPTLIKGVKRVVR